MKKIIKIIIILLIIVLVLGLCCIFGNKIRERNKITYANIIPQEKFIDSYYTDVILENNNNYRQDYIVTVEIIDISKELLNENFVFLFGKKLEYNNTYYEVLRTDTRHLSTSHLANKLYFNYSVDAGKREEYRLYFWLTDMDMSNKDMNIKYRITIREDNEKIKEDVSLEKCDNLKVEPVISDGLIAVNIDDYGRVKTIKDKDDWYNYCEKRWANAVLVKENKREKYQNNDDIEINLDDILAYFVWIPRYSYKLWVDEYDEDQFGSEQRIEIKFINKNEKDTGSKKNKWYTHPAFTFGDVELSGIWVGKFEITGSIEKPTILPNNEPIVNYSLGDYFESSLLFSGGKLNNNQVVYHGNNYYGLSNKTNSHLIKNSEWGAVVYLSHSSYGINNRIRINNYFNKINLTGCAAMLGEESSVAVCNNAYSKVSVYPQSTTGNVTGIFDLSGGTGEYVMTYLDGNNNLSEISEEWFMNDDNLKYYDYYSSDIFNKKFNINIENCSLSSCGGHALYETFNWYMSIHNFSDFDYNFIKRGCGNFSGLAASEFCFGYATGEGGGGTSSRVVLVTEKD